MNVTMIKSLTIIWVAVAVLLTSGQQLPGRNEDQYQFQKANEENFYDTHLIPDGSEVSSYVLKDKSARFFFIVEENDSPLAIHVAPCSSSITTRIRYQLRLEDLESEKTADAKDDLLSQMRKNAKKNRGAKRLLHTHTGSEEVKYQNETSLSGVYSIEIIAHDRHTTVYLYATTTPHSDRLFPEQPKDATIKVIRVTNEVISVAWKPSPTEIKHGLPVKYCVAANRKQNFGLRCAAYTSRYGDVPPTPPPNAGFGFPGEKEAMRKMRRIGRKNAKGASAENQVFYSCVGNKTSYTFSRLQSGAVYYIDVFSVNSLTNKSTTYIGTNLTTAMCPVEKVSHIRTRKVYKYQTKNVNCTLAMEHALKKRTAALEIGIQTCVEADHQLETTVVQNEGQLTVLDKVIVSEWPIMKVSVPNPSLGSYRIRLKSTEQSNVAFKMAVAYVENGLPFPVLPNNRTIQVVNDGNVTCNSLTLMWNIPKTDKPQQYCLYMGRQKPTTVRGHKSNVNRCVAGDNLRKKGGKVMCKTITDNGMHAITSMVEVVSDLRPSTRYTFDVVAIKEGRESVAYDTLSVKTRRC